MSQTVRGPLRLAALGSALFVIWLVAAGCGGGTISAEQALNQSIQQNGGAKAELVKFGGTVTVDGELAKAKVNEAMVVMLYDPKNPPDSAHPVIHAACDSEGHFEFGTYTRDDGVPAGSYTVLFAQLRSNLFKNQGYHPPDRLKNLYNDPDKSEFHVDLTGTGRTDYEFALAVAGKDGNTTPAAKAITTLKR
jgi:hypothetical protein